MKRIIFSRHAKSSWDDMSMDDHDRPLNQRGLRDAPIMGKRLAEKALKPCHIVSSSAHRALATAKLIVPELGLSHEKILVDPRLYLASVKDMLHVAHETPEACNKLMLFAHNPGMTDAAVTLGNFRIHNLPTCGVFCLDFHAERWKDIGHNTPTEQVFLETPKGI